MKLVVIGGERPKLDSSWPTAFSNLLTKCWHADPTQRPSFSAIVDELDRLLQGEVSSRKPSRSNSVNKVGPDYTNSHSTWF